MALHRKLGEILIRYYRVPSAAVDAALATQRETRARLGEALLRERAVVEDDLVRALAFQHGLPAVFRIADASIDASVIRALPPWLVAWERVVPIARTTSADGRSQLVVATAEPRSKAILAEMEAHAKCPVQLVLTRPDEILEALKRFYGSGAQPSASDTDEHEPTALTPTVPAAPEIEWDTVTGAH